MTIVLVHGVPETDAVWDPLVAVLAASGRDDVVRLSPPGFGSPPPAGWSATREDYCAWLTGQLEAIGAPVDLVGHDWGGAHVLTVAMRRPDLLRTWASDVPGLFDPGYVWHELAQRWQRAGDGETAVADMAAATVEVRAEGLVSAGMEPATAAAVASGFDDVMGACILRLYRSARQPELVRLGRGLRRAAARPGLAVLPSDDHRVGTDEQRRRAATTAGARIKVLTGLGHWWMTKDPHGAADMLTEFWASIPSSPATETGRPTEMDPPR